MGERLFYQIPLGPDKLKAVLADPTVDTNNNNVLAGRINRELEQNRIPIPQRKRTVLFNSGLKNGQ